MGAKSAALALARAVTALQPSLAGLCRKSSTTVASKLDPTSLCSRQRCLGTFRDQFGFVFGNSGQYVNS